MILEFNEYLQREIGTQELEIHPDGNNIEVVDIALIKLDKIIEIMEDFQSIPIQHINIEEQIEYFKKLRKELEKENSNNKHTKTI